MHFVRQPNNMIDHRYRIISELGQGGSGVTYEAEMLSTGQRVALKELSLKGLKDWKQVELFEREARTLKGLSHPSIPQYVDYFQVDTPDNRWFYLAQEIAEGTSLADLVASGWRVDEAETRAIAEAVLQVLTYLHGLNPPVIHRDIKPQNMLRRNDGHIYLVDFGAVQTVYRHTMSLGSTVVGTYGYMAPEQFRGQAVPATDLYGLGATLLFLLTHQSPADLPQQRLRLDFRPYVSVSPGFADWLDKLLDPLVEDRFASAQQALSALLQPTSINSGTDAKSLARPAPAGTRVELQKSPMELSLAIPPMGLRGETLTLILFALFWDGGVLLWTLAALSGGAPLVFVLFAMPFWLMGLAMLVKIANDMLRHTQLHIDAQHFVLQHRLAGWSQRLEGDAEDLSGVELQTTYTKNGRPMKTIVLHAGVNTYKFGSTLSKVEKEWLAQELERFVGERVTLP
jgi:hypothetical protein